MESATPFTLLAVTAGYLFTKLTHFTSFRVERLSGYHLLFESAIWGAVLVGVSHLLIVSLGGLDAPLARFAQETWRSYTAAAGLGTFALALLLSMLLPQVVNLVFPRERAVRKGVHRLAAVNA